MGSQMNWLGVGAWIIVIIYLAFIVQFIRQRRIRMIIVNHKTWSWKSLAIDSLLVLVFLVAAGTLTYLASFRSVSVTSTKDVKVTYHTQPLIMQVEGRDGYFVRVNSGETKSAIQTYTYWTEGHKNQVKSINASIATGKKPIAIGAKAYQWPKKLVQQSDQKYHQAFVGEMEGTFKPTLLNALGMRVGHNALDYVMIRVPSSLFIIKD